MGVQVRLVVYAPSEEAALSVCRAAYKRIAELDTIMSDYRIDSELTKLCRRAGGPPVAVSEDLFNVLQIAQDFSRESDGAFDITVGPLVQLWRTARKTGQMPPADKLEAARKLVGWQKIKLDPEKRTVQLLAAGMKLDLGGIGKGYAGDEAMKIFRRFGLPRAFYVAGGDVVVGDAPPGETGWGMDVTNELPGDKPLHILIHNCAVSTSGDTEQNVVIDGQRYSHIVDPRTGLGLTHSNLVSIVAKDGRTAEGLSKIASILPPEQSLPIVKAHGATAYIRRPEN
jgi:thiamine biosynthesis lipoprotein